MPSAFQSSKNEDVPRIHLYAPRISVLNLSYRELPILPYKGAVGSNLLQKLRVFNGARLIALYPTVQNKAGVSSRAALSEHTGI